MDIVNKRNQTRVRVSLDVGIYDILNNKSFTGRIIDISKNGVSILADEEFPVNTPLSLTFTFEEAVYKNIPADVVRGIKKQNNKYFGSAVFSPDAKLQQQLEKSVKKVYLKNRLGLKQETLYNIYRP